ncbi:11599_t:CDS:2, partial [Gigaspora margarita]
MTATVATTAAAAMTVAAATAAAAAMTAAAATATGTNTASVDTAVPFLVEPDELYIDYLENLVKIKDQIIEKLSQEPDELYIDYLEDLVKVKDRMLKDQKKIIEQLSQDNETLIKENSDLYEDLELLTS